MLRCWSGPASSSLRQHGALGRFRRSSRGAVRRVILCNYLRHRCPRCRAIRLRPISWLPRISLGLTIAQLSARLRCAECGGQLHSVKPWRLEEVLGKPSGRRPYLDINIYRGLRSCCLSKAGLPHFSRTAAFILADNPIPKRSPVDRANTRGFSGSSDGGTCDEGRENPAT